MSLYSSHSQGISKPTTNHHNAGRKKSRTGCITCKIRKKRCDEKTPICGDCARLGRECCWITDDMSDADITIVKNRLEEVEQCVKRRRRSSKKCETPVAQLSPGFLSLFQDEDISLPSLLPPAGSMGFIPGIGQIMDDFLHIPFDSTFDASIGKEKPRFEELDGDEGFEHIVAMKTPLTIETPDMQQVSYPMSQSLSRSTTPILDNLDDQGMQLYTYYRDHLASIVNIGPKETNFYRKVFLPMAHENLGMMYAICAWSAFHLDKQYFAVGNSYVEKSLAYMQSHPVACKNDVLLRLANLLVLCGAEICAGDVSKWAIYLQWGFKLIVTHGGLTGLAENASTESNWLLANFAYHDVLASSVGDRRSTYFSMHEYDLLFEKAGVDPLHGINRPLFSLLGEITGLCSDAKDIFQKSASGFLSGTSPESTDENDKTSRYDSLRLIMEKASIIEDKLEECKPRPRDLKSISDQDLELQLTLFETFKLTAKLHLQQSVLKVNPSALRMQFLLYELLQLLDILLGTKVESSLCFPLFMAGINCTTHKDREKMNARFDRYMASYRWKNITRVKIVMEKVWEACPNGDVVVDWHEIVRHLGWDVSFA